MRLGEGVEWAAHVCVLLHWLQTNDPRPVPVARLAEAYELPAPYLSKQLQALTRAGITESVPGARGGVRLTRSAEEISLMDVVAAVEGTENAFACTEIRQQGMNAAAPAREFSQPCAIAVAMRTAELAWRRHLAATTIGELADATPARVARDARRYFAHA